MLAEKMYYQDESARITSARAIIGSKTYAMANITSVSIEETVLPTRRTEWSCLAIMLIFTGWGFLPLLLYNFNIVLLILSLISFGGGAFLIHYARKKKPIYEYAVRIGSASGETDALISKDRGYVQEIVAAMNKAIVERG